MHACMLAYVHMYIHACMHACIHTYIHLCTHVHIWIYAMEFKLWYLNSTIYIYIYVYDCIHHGTIQYDIIYHTYMYLLLFGIPSISVNWFLQPVKQPEQVMECFKNWQEELLEPKLRDLRGNVLGSTITISGFPIHGGTPKWMVSSGNPNGWFRGPSLFGLVN